MTEETGAGRCVSPCSWAHSVEAWDRASARKAAETAGQRVVDSAPGFARGIDDPSGMNGRPATGSAKVRVGPVENTRHRHDAQVSLIPAGTVLGQNNMPHLPSSFCTRFGRIICRQPMGIPGDVGSTLPFGRPTTSSIGKRRLQPPTVHIGLARDRWQCFTEQILSFPRNEVRPEFRSGTRINSLHLHPASTRRFVAFCIWGLTRRKVMIASHSPAL